MAWHGDPSNKVPNPIQEDINRSEERVGHNRALDVRRDTDRLKNFSVNIKDVDETVFNHLQKMQLSVIDAGNTINVPISYASPEKWKSVKNDGFMRDNQGKIILPALIFYRASSEADKNMMTFNKYLRYPIIQQYSQKNQYTKFSKLFGKNAPVHEVYSVVMPDHMTFNYKFMIWTEYIEQMNTLIERINFETNDYWGSSTGFRFRTSVDSYQHTTEVESGKDRLVRTEFDLTLKGYLLPDQFAPGLDGFKSTTEKSFTAKKIIMGVEVTATDWNPNIDDEIKDKWRSQKYPNIRKGQEPASPPISFDDTTFKAGFKTIYVPVKESYWHLPAPPTSDSPGEEGWASYDTDYYYFYSGGHWRRVPIVLFNIF